MSLECPSCKLVNPVSARICDCGHLFKGGGLTSKEESWLRRIREEAEARRGLRWWAFSWRLALILASPFVVAGFLLLYEAIFPLPPSVLTPGEALELARGQLLRDAEAFGTYIGDLAPPRLERNGDGTYTIKWKHSRPGSQPEYSVFVERDGWTESSSEDGF